jgi:TolB-like protein
MFGATPTQPQKLSIAVLPVTNLSGDAQTEQVAVGIATTVARNLSTVRGITVASQVDTARYREGNRNVQAALRELGVTVMLDIALERVLDSLQDARHSVMARLVRSPYRRTTTMATSWSYNAICCRRCPACCGRRGSPRRLDEGTWRI